MVPNCGDVAVQRADGEARTRDLILTMDALYQLSYVGLKFRILPPPYRRSRLARHPGTTWASVCARRISSII